MAHKVQAIKRTKVNCQARYARKSARHKLLKGLTADSRSGYKYRGK